MFEKILKVDQGVTHGAFRDKDEAASIPPDEENEEGIEVKKSDDILDTEQYVYVPEVVREPRMHFYLVPRLGCYLAVPLTYHSCLTEEALDAAVADYYEVIKAQAEQAKLRAEWEEEQERLREEKEKAGEVYEPEYKEWEEITFRPFEGVKEQYVVCLDTLG